MFAQSLGAAHTSPRTPSTPAGRCSPSSVLLSIPGHPLILPGHQLSIPTAGPYPTSCSACSCTQRGSVPVPHPAAAHCPAGTQKPCLCHGQLRRRLKGLPGWPGETSLTPFPPPPALEGSPGQGRGGGFSKAPIEHSPVSLTNSWGSFSQQRPPPHSPPYVPLCLCCWSREKKKGRKKIKINFFLLIFNASPSPSVYLVTQSSGDLNPSHPERWK